MLNIQKNKEGKDVVSARELHEKLEVKEKFPDWIKRMIDYGFTENQDYSIIEYDYKGVQINRKSVNQYVSKREYILTIDTAKEIAMIQRSPQGKKIRQWLIDLSNKRENLKLITPQEAGFAYKVIELFRYADMRKEAHEKNKDSFAFENSHLKKNVYAFFYEERKKYVGYNKSELIKHCTDIAKEKQLKPPKQTDSFEKILAKFDKYEALKNAILDTLMEKKVDIKQANKFADLCKELALAANITLYVKNETNLFQTKEDLTENKGLISNFRKMLGV